MTILVVHYNILVDTIDGKYANSILIFILYEIHTIVIIMVFSLVFTLCIHWYPKTPKNTASRAMQPTTPPSIAGTSSSLKAEKKLLKNMQDFKFDKIKN